ncbi:MAG: hypothetical protein K8W52_12135 [Deltaproteobacteria bacterium]|nr:hypothetical protein [Deltaproteobacteria bacterium]
MRAVLAVGTALWLSACSDQSFRAGMTVMCEAATPTRIAIEDPALRERILIAWIDDHLTNDDARAALRAMAAAAPAERPRIVRAAAIEAGLAQCALVDFLEHPPPPPGPRAVAAADPAVDAPVVGAVVASDEPVILDVSPPRVAPGSVEVGEVSATGALTPEQIRAQLTPANLAAIATCYQEARAATPALGGRLAIDLAADGAGHATEVHVTGLTDELGACVARAVGGWQFAPASGVSRATVQLDLAPQS